MLCDLPRDLANIVCAFAYNASLEETKRSLGVILELKKNYLHPYVKANKVCDYTCVTDGWYYDRVEMRPGLLAPFCMQVKRNISPFEQFFVWFAFSDLWNIPKISQVVFDMDWRKAGWIRRETGFRDRQSFLLWVATTTKGILYCSNMLTKIRLSMLRKYPTNISRYLACDHFDEWVGYLI